VKETVGGQTVWDGTVEVFDLQGHPKAKRAYAWAHETDEPTQLRRYVTVLHISGVTSAVIAVKAAIPEKLNLASAFKDCFRQSSEGSLAIGRTAP
jgi:hypothetical protein